MPPERTRPRPATTDRGRQAEHDDALDPNDTSSGIDAHVDDGSTPPVEAYEGDPAAQPEPDDDADDVEVVGGFQARVPDDTYRARYVGREPRQTPWGPSLVLSFHLLDSDQAGALVQAWRRLKESGEHSRSRVPVGPHSKLAQELRTLAAQRGRHMRPDRLSTAVLEGVDVDVRTRTVTRGSDGRQVDPYSVVEHIEGLHGLTNTPKPKDPTGAERTRRWRARRKATAVTDRHADRHRPSQLPSRERHATAVTPPASPDTARFQAVTPEAEPEHEVLTMKEREGGGEGARPCPRCRGEGEPNCWCGGTGKVKA